MHTDTETSFFRAIAVDKSQPVGSNVFIVSSAALA
jgi:hypothetical protein